MADCPCQQNRLFDWAVTSSAGPSAGLTSTNTGGYQVKPVWNNELVQRVCTFMSRAHLTCSAVYLSLFVNTHLYMYARLVYTGG